MAPDPDEVTGTYRLPAVRDSAGLVELGPVEGQLVVEVGEEQLEAPAVCPLCALQAAADPGRLLLVRGHDQFTSMKSGSSIAVSQAPHMK